MLESARTALLLDTDAEIKLKELAKRCQLHITPDVNILAYPELDENLSKPENLCVLGDAHGNPLLLMQFFIRSGVMSLPAADYRMIVESYYLLSLQIEILDFINEAHKDIEIYKGLLVDIDDNYLDRHKMKACLKLSRRMNDLKIYKDDIINMLSSFNRSAEQTAYFNESSQIYSTSLNNLAQLILDVFNINQHNNADVLNEKLELVVQEQTNIIIQTEENIELFTTIISEADVNTEKMLKLIGDELADRGICDWLTLVLLKRVISENSHASILLSNHTMVFIKVLELYIANDVRLADEFKEIENHEQQYHSILGLKILLENKIISTQQVKEIYDSIYMTALKLVDYSLTPDFKNITIYTHAPSGFCMLHEIAEFFLVEYDDSSALKLIETIDRINHQFKEYVIDYKTFELMDIEYIPQYINLEPGNDNMIIRLFQAFLWNRKYTLDCRPALQDNTTVIFGNGHNTSKNDKRPNKVCVDGKLGKSLSLCEGQLRVAKSPQVTTVQAQLATLDQNIDNPVKEILHIYKDILNEVRFSNTDLRILQKLLYLNQKWKALEEQLENHTPTYNNLAYEQYRQLLESEAQTIDALMTSQSNNIVEDIIERLAAFHQSIQNRIDRVQQFPTMDDILSSPRAKRKRTNSTSSTSSIETALDSLENQVNLRHTEKQPRLLGQ